MSAHTFDPPRSVRRLMPFELACLTAPTLMLGYGVLRLVDGTDDAYGPGLAWNVGHALFLAAMVAFGVVLVGLRRRLPLSSTAARVAADVVTVASGAGLAVLVRMAVIDLMVGLSATNGQEMSEGFDRYRDVPVALPQVALDVGPALLFVGLTALLTLHAALPPRRLPAWSPTLFAVGSLLLQVNLDLMPVGALLLIVALAPCLTVAAPGARSSSPAPAVPSR